jgi:hypothetical protein
LSTCPAEVTRDPVLSAVRAARDRYSEMRAAFDDIRNANDYRELDQARRALVEAMGRQDLPTGKQYVTALLSKALSPGSSRETERLLSVLSRARNRVAHQIETAVDSRSFAYWLLQQPRSRSLMSATIRKIVMAEPSDAQVYQAFLRLTLEPCVDSCPECLGTNGETVGLAPSRRLVDLWLGAAPMHIIDVDDNPAWNTQLLDALRQHPRVRLRHGADHRATVAATLAAILTAEIDRGFHSSPVRVAGVRRFADRWQTDLEIDTWEGR